MSRKLFVLSTALIAVLVTAMPVYAQYGGSHQGGPGLFGGIMGFFSNLFHPQNNPQGQQGSPPISGNPSQNVPSGMMYSNPSGQPDRMTMQENRLEGLVRAGKITEAQRQAIITELTNVQNELRSWAQSQGINPAYVLGGGLGLGTGQGMMRPDITGQPWGGQQEGAGNQQGGYGQQQGGYQGQGMMQGQGYQQRGMPPGQPQGQGY